MDERVVSNEELNEDRIAELSKIYSVKTVDRTVTAIKSSAFSPKL